MSEIIIRKSNNLKGTVNISGSKNSALPIMAATIAVCGNTILNNIPMLSDTLYMTDLLNSCGCIASIEKNIVKVCTDNINNYILPYNTVSKLRASFLLSGPMLARFGKAVVPMPGGCAIGTRPVDLHLKGLRKLGADIYMGNGYVELSADKLIANEIYLDFPSVGATENILISACLAKGETHIINAATEPEVTDLANFLIKCGAKISGAGTEHISVIGVEELNECEYTIISDRIEAGTFMIACAIAGGKIKLNNVCSEHISPICAKLKDMGVNISTINDTATIIRNNDIFPVNIKTMPHPGFPTDMQSIFSSLMCFARGTSIITETIFENRFMHIPELVRMQAKARIDGRCAVIEGSGNLCGAQVNATDLRAGASLVLAGIGAKGITRVSNAVYIDRGYENFVDKMQNIGVDIETTKLYM